MSSALDGRKLAQQDKYARICTAIALGLVVASFGSNLTMRQTIFLCLAITSLIVAAFVRYHGQSCYPFC